MIAHQKDIPISYANNNVHTNMKKYILFLLVVSMACIRQLNLNYKPTLEGDGNVQTQSGSISTPNNRYREIITSPAKVSGVYELLRARNRQDPDDDRRNERSETPIVIVQSLDSLPEQPQIQLANRDRENVISAMGCSCSIRPN